jgi:general secretion pathway protein K
MMRRPRFKKNERGAALMMAIFTVTMLMVIATEIMYETNVELVVSSQEINKVKAHYAAKAGVAISLLRIHVYRKVAALAGSQVPASTLDPIWQFPFAWPPAVPDSVNGVDKEEIKAAVKKSSMQAQYLATIESEGSRIDINDLSSPNKPMADAARDQLLQIFNNQVQADEGFGEKYRGYDFNRLINSIADWSDSNKESRNGGDKRAAYGERATDFIPANSPFKTIDELHLVDGMNDELFDLIQPRITVFGSKGINVNYASKDVLMSLTPQITAERADKIVADRASTTRGPFKDKEDFVQYLDSLGVNGDPFVDKEGNPTVSLLFNAEYNFRIHSTGIAGRAQRDIIAITYDLDRVKKRLTSLFAASPSPSATPAVPANPNLPPGQTPTPAPSASPTTDNDNTAPTGPPNIVYWNET